MSLEKGHVLLVDDDRHILDVLSEVLKKQGYRVTTAGSGEVALEILEVENPDSVLLDLKMPGMDGFETLKAIKETKPQMPVIMLTAFGYEEELVDKALKMGAVGYIGKNLPLDNIISTFDWLSEMARKGKLERRGVKILVVDDDKQIGALLQEFLEKHGYKVLAANDSEKAVDAARKERPDLILLDVIMPGLSGVETLEKIREFNKQVKVIMMSVSKDDKTSKYCQELGACDYISKPFTLEFLLAKITEKL